MSAKSTDTESQISWTAKTHAGRIRTNNEDTFLNIMFDHQNLAILGSVGESKRAGMEFIFAVSDGMGGANAGEFASRIATQTVIELISREFHQKRSQSLVQPAELLAIFFQIVHEKTYKTGRYYEECQGMGATLSLCWCSGDTLFIGHIGDSRIYHFPAAGGMDLLTIDHTRVGRLKREGILNEREARESPYKHQLERAIGTDPGTIIPQITS
ncbi:protein phosphatase 2C domain-containing protein, partial [Verrucomicrobia bacterium]|nr:protein phosphatase 2C domain-containing protein [Verrucomicrobiota bacterium]